jgi:hypothetical protein
LLVGSGFEPLVPLPNITSPRRNRRGDAGRTGFGDAFYSMMYNANKRSLVPMIYPWRDFVSAGGLISYGPSPIAGFRQIGIYTGRILRGAKPADLPSSKQPGSSWFSISAPPKRSA